MTSTVARLAGAVVFAVIAATPLLSQEEEPEETVFINMRALSAVELRLYRGFEEQVDSMVLEEAQVHRMLREISESLLFDAAQSSLRSAVIQRLGHGTEDWLLGLLGSSQVEIQLVAIAALSESELAEPVAKALNNVVRNDEQANEVRASALGALGWAEQIRMEKSDLYSMVTSEDTPLARTAAIYFVHPACELAEDGPGPDTAFERRLRALFVDGKDFVRHAAATCFLVDGGWWWYEESSRLATESIRIVGEQLLDPKQDPVRRGGLIRSLSMWWGNRYARKLIREMLKEENWFFGASGQHWSVHSLVLLVHELEVHDEVKWARKALSDLHLKEERILAEQGGDFALWHLKAALNRSSDNG